jgi:hypothetical protein
MRTIDGTVVCWTFGPYSQLWFVQAADLSMLRIDGRDVLAFDVDDEAIGPGLSRQFYSFTARVKGRLRIRWFLWRHGAR